MESKAKWIAIGVFLILLYGCLPEEKEMPVQKLNETLPETKDLITESLSPGPDNSTINYCRDYCSFVQGGENERLEYNESSRSFFCYCSDYQNELAAKTEISWRDLKLYSQKKIWWGQMPITYALVNEEDCGGYETRKIAKAFQQIEDAAAGAVQFQKINASADIEITCKYIKDCYKKEIDIRKEEGVIYKYESICAHAAGVAQITRMQGFMIKKAEIDIIGLDGFAETAGRGASGFYIGGCGHPTVEIHEILHTFGFGHSNDPESVMYHQTELVPYTIQQEGACIGSDKPISKDIIDELLLVYG